MQITITLAELNGVVGNLNKIIEKPIPARYAYKLGKAARFFRQELNDLQQQVNALALKYGTPEGDSVRVPQERMPDFNKEYIELTKEQIVFNFDPLPLSVFGDIAIAASDMAWLEQFFYDDEPDEDEEAGMTDEEIAAYRDPMAANS